MTKFKNYISESSVDKGRKSLQEFSEQVKKDCKPYLRAVKDCTWYYLFRGISAGRSNFIYNRPVRQDRRPLNMHPDMHNNFNKVFKKKFGWYARSQGLFVTGNESQAGAYGPQYLVFPIGSFKFIWSPEVEDLYNLPGEYKFAGEIFNSQTPPDEYTEIIEDLKFTDKNLCKAIGSHGEIMIQCKAYHALATKFFIWNDIHINDYFIDYLL